MSFSKVAISSTPVASGEHCVRWYGNVRNMCSDIKPTGRKLRIVQPVLFIKNGQFRTLFSTVKTLLGNSGNIQHSRTILEAFDISLKLCF